MLDYRMETFLKLCETMNYRETAEALHITQPAVTQHIHFLEKEYGCKLFHYEKRHLEKTEAAKRLEEYTISMKYNEETLKKEIIEGTLQKLRIGVTKTIGDYVISDLLKQFLQNPDYTVELVMENTEHLLCLLEENHLDFVIVEGYFDKKRYDHHIFQHAPFTGICSEKHPFAGTVVSIEELLEETLICREEGSGTRAILEQKLLEFNETVQHCKRVITSSSVRVITDLVRSNIGISFAFRVIAEQSEGISTFSLPGDPMVRDFQFVYLKNTTAREKIALLEGEMKRG